MNRVYPYAERESWMSLAAVYKESFIRDVVCVCVCVCVSDKFILVSATWHPGKEKHLDLELKKN
jgi:hypothetical protein